MTARGFGIEKKPLVPRVPLFFSYRNFDFFLLGSWAVNMARLTRTINIGGDGDGGGEATKSAQFFKKVRR